MGGGGFGMVERVSVLVYLGTRLTILISRMIFPNKFGTKKKQTDNHDKIEPDPGSIRSKAKHARLARAEERRRQAAEEPAEEAAQTED